MTISDSVPARPTSTLRHVLMLAVPFVFLLASCTTDAQQTVDTGTSQEPTTDATAPTTAPTEAATTAPAATAAPPADATEVPAAASPPCDTVPAFSAADTVSIACSGTFAVSPELFANNAGWHLFQAQEGQWVEIDYARTCCDADDVRFTQLLGRNGIDAATLTQLCAAAGLTSDPATGCAAGGEDNQDAEFEGTWLRVNGLGEHDFSTDQDVVLASIEEVFGPPDSLVEASECGAGPMMVASFDDFTAQFQDGVFIGWYYISSTPELSTPSGVMVGISEADLTIVYEGVEIMDGSLGREFFFEVPAGFMAGFISDTDATVTSLYAGTNCFFR